MQVNLVIIQPVDYVHSLVFIDVARALRYALRQVGFDPYISKNRLRIDCVNWILGAHLNLNFELIKGFRCVIVNLEQLGKNGAELPTDYIELLRKFPVLDYDPGNLSAYCVNGSHVGLFEFFNVPYLKKSDLQLRSRPIDLLFYGSVNERRRRIINQIERCGVPVTVFDRPLYTEERDEFIRISKAVLNLSFYETHRFEQVRAFHCLSLATPIVTEKVSGQNIPEQFLNSIWFFDQESPNVFFEQTFATEVFYEHSVRGLNSWFEQLNPSFEPLKKFTHESANNSLGFCQSYANACLWRTRKINIGCGRDYRIGWLNIDAKHENNPDICIDLGHKLPFPLILKSHHIGALSIDLNCATEVSLNVSGQEIHQQSQLIINVLKMLEVGGALCVTITFFDLSIQEIRKPETLNNEELILVNYIIATGVCDSLSHCLKFRSIERIDNKQLSCQSQVCRSIRIRFTKHELSPWERTLARVASAQFGGLPDDVLYNNV